ncbi:helix-turn-helix domain-containing protein [Phytohabitans suffuscus]|uniref:Helix-turn-helix domain-containing protein n=1 Tax=Phytohabitans suffuscus TaxID=624315 RepID=A0A6F8YE99_9ACTN|nr:helix-turn-helix domain-containing protein [Phytohabitans suffuscus]BCB84464.1 hypothetical protein Psuf_017770 [Phytohabitans suffuscus]
MQGTQITTRASFRSQPVASWPTQTRFKPREPVRRTYCRAPAVAAPADDFGQEDNHAARTFTPTLLTVDEACRMLRISRPKLYEYINSRQLRTVRFGSRRLVPLPAIRALVDQLSDREAL